MRYCNIVSTILVGSITEYDWGFTNMISRNTSDNYNIIFIFIDRLIEKLEELVPHYLQLKLNLLTGTKEIIALLTNRIPEGKYILVVTMLL